MRKLVLISALVIILSFILSGLVYTSLPSILVSHWDTNSNPNGYLSKNIALFLLPIILVILFLLFLAIPHIDPLKKNIKSFRTTYDTFILVFVLFMFIIHFLTILWNLGYEFNLSKIITIFVAGLFIYIGFIFKKLKRNWFIGIRTPWTISNDKVWKKTHELGSILFKIIGVILLIGLFFPQYFLWFVLVPTLSTAIFLTIYSYYLYRKLKK